MIMNNVKIGLYSFVLPNPADLLPLLLVSENSDYSNMIHYF